MYDPRPSAAHCVILLSGPQFHVPLDPLWYTQQSSTYPPVFQRRSVQFTGYGYCAAAMQFAVMNCGAVSILARISGAAACSTPCGVAMHVTLVSTPHPPDAAHGGYTVGYAEPIAVAVVHSRHCPYPLHPHHIEHAPRPAKQLCADIGTTHSSTGWPPASHDALVTAAHDGLTHVTVFAVEFTVQFRGASEVVSVLLSDSVCVGSTQPPFDGAQPVQCGAISAAMQQ